MRIRQALINLSRKHSIVIIDGPRSNFQKELVTSTFPTKPYISLDDSRYRKLLADSPSAFFMAFPEGAIIDEVQKIPASVSSVYLDIARKGYQPGKYILIYHGMLKLEVSEPESVLTVIPPVQETDNNPFLQILNAPKPDLEKLYSDSVSQINSSNLEKFAKFLRLCAYMNGTTVSAGSLAKNVGITSPTASKWLQILSDAGILFNIESLASSRYQTVKKGKFFFLSTGLLCSLLGITDLPQLILSPHLNEIVMAFTVSQLVRFRCDQGLKPNLSFYQERNGFEIDILAKWKQHWSFTVSETLETEKHASDKAKKSLKLFPDCRPAVLYLGELTLNFERTEWISYHDWEKLASGLNWYS